MAATRVRRVILTGSVVVASISGALYGASLKMNQEAKQEAEIRRSATTQEKVNALLGVREGLVAKKTLIEKQVRQLEEKQQTKRAAALEKAGKSGNEDGRRDG